MDKHEERVSRTDFITEKNHLEPAKVLILNDFIKVVGILVDLVGLNYANKSLISEISYILTRIACVEHVDFCVIRWVREAYSQHCDGQSLKDLKVVHRPIRWLY